MELSTIAGTAVALVLVAAFLAGIRLMQSPRTALWGNRLGALAMLCAIAWTFAITGRGPAPSAILYIAIGAAIGLILGQAVRMIHMPQTVALLNGLGGAASALVAWSAAALLPGEGGHVLFHGTSGLAVGVGALTFSGSMVAVLKLQGLAFRRAIQFKGHGPILRSAVLLAVLLIILNMSLAGQYSDRLMPAVVLLSLGGGFIMALRIGGADMPIVISLLNSFSGTAAAVAGLAVENMILTGTGALVGVAGLILTGIMCRAMNRSLLSVLAGFAPGPGRKDVVASDSGEPSGVESGQPGAGEPTVAEPGETSTQSGPAAAPPDLAAALLNAGRVIIVPGYGMAVSQAQSAVRRLMDVLEKGGREVKFAIHPVAGRMPGHMNVLLAEAGIDYEKLLDLDSVNPQFAHADLAIVVGACDVVNPAANSVEGTPISGMPVLDAEKAKLVIVCNLDEKPGYSGVENLLYSRDNVITIWGDATETLSKLTAIINEA